MPTDIVEAPKFPVDSLPPRIKDFVVACATSLSAAPELVAIPALAVTAAAIGNSRAMAVKDGWTEPSSVYAAVVSPSGTMKTPALQMAAEPLQRLGAGDIQTWTADVTVEKLARLLSTNPRGLLLVRDELAAWVKSMNQYKQKGADREFYLSVWSGAPSRVDRVGEGSVIISDPCLSVVGCIPPDIVSKLNNEDGSEDGFMPRMLFAWPEPVPVRWTNTTVPVEVRHGYSELVSELFQLPYAGESTLVPMTTDAQRTFTNWHDNHCAEAEDPALVPYLRAAYAKLKGYCARLSLIHAVGTSPSTQAVGIESVDAGIKMVTYFKTQAEKVMPLLSPVQTSEIERCKASIHKRLSVCRYMSKRDLQRASAFDATIFNQALAELCRPTVAMDSNADVYLYEPTNRQATPARSPLEAQPGPKPSAREA